MFLVGLYQDFVEPKYETGHIRGPKINLSRKKVMFPKNFSDLGSEPVPCPTRSWSSRGTWERLINIKEFFKKFGQVNGIIYLGNNMNGVQQAVVSFKDSLVAMRLVGTQQKILYGEHEVMEVSRDTFGKKGWGFVG